jgi:hypothetical protein
MKLAQCFSMVENKHPHHLPSPLQRAFIYCDGSKHAIPPESMGKTIDVSINMRCLRNQVVGKPIHF